MFGFIRPVKPELKVREVERFKQVYCGLCHAIKERYGSFHTMFLSYDMTFMALLLSSLEEDEPAIVYKRCAASPIIKKPSCIMDNSIEHTADLSVLLNYHKLNDTIMDEKAVKRSAARVLKAMAKPAYKKAKAKNPKADEIMYSCLKELSEIEKAKTASLDKPADAFARLMTCAVKDSYSNYTARILKQLFYHTGRWVYLIDACADLKDDLKSGLYNPVALRFGLNEPDLSKVREPLEITLERSLIDIYNAFQLLDVKRDYELMENIICLGMPMVTRQVLDGTYQSNGGQNRHGSL